MVRLQAAADDTKIRGLGEGYRRRVGMMGGGIHDADVECGTVGPQRLVDLSAELALPRGPDGIKAFALAGRELAELVKCLLGKFEGVAGNGQGVIVIKDGEEVARVDAGTWGIGDEEGATAVTRRHKGVHVEVSLTLVVWSRRC